MTAPAFRPSQTLRVIDAAGWTHGGKPRKPPFTEGEIVTVEAVHGGSVTLWGKPGMWKAARFTPA